MGVDFNSDHLAAAEIDRFGNPLGKTQGKAFERLDTFLDFKTSGQREAILAEAVKQVVARAAAAGKPIVRSSTSPPRRHSWRT